MVLFTNQDHVRSQFISAMEVFTNQDHPRAAGASVSACAGLTNQLLSCWVDPHIAWKITLTWEL